MQRSKKSTHKLLAILLLLLTLAVLFLLVVLPIYAKYQNTKEEIASLQHRLLQYKTISGKTKGLSNKLAKLEAFNADQEYYFSDTKAALASAELQGMIKEILNRHSAKILSTQPVTSGNQDERQVKVAVHCRADIVSLRKLLYELETHVPVLIIDNINIGRGFQTTFRDELSENVTEALDVRFEISGYMASSEESNR